MNSIPTAIPDASISFPMLGEGFVIDPPRFFPVFGWRIYLYGIVIALGFVLAVVYCLRRSRQFGLTEDNVLDLVIICIPSAIVGARILYVLANPAGYFGPGQLVNILKVWEGGLAIYGGLILAAMGVLIYSAKKRVNIGSLLDISALGLLIGQFIGRWGNFFNCEAFGRETDIFCRMGLSYGGATYYVHPTFLYESLWNLAGFILLHFISRKHRKFNGQIFAMYVAWYGLGRTLIDGLRTDVPRIFGGTFGVYQLIALLSFCAAAIFLILKLSKLRGAPALPCGPEAAQALDASGQPEGAPDVPDSTGSTETAGPAETADAAEEAAGSEEDPGDGDG